MYNRGFSGGGGAEVYKFIHLIMLCCIRLSLFMRLWAAKYTLHASQHPLGNNWLLITITSWIIIIPYLGYYPYTAICHGDQAALKVYIELIMAKKKLSFYESFQ